MGRLYKTFRGQKVISNSKRNHGLLVKNNIVANIGEKLQHRLALSVLACKSCSFLDLPPPESDPKPQSKLNTVSNMEEGTCAITAAENCNECLRNCNILNLPVELLIYIISYLPTVDDKMKLRYVSRKLRLVVNETPSLWSEFVLPLYDRRQERSVMNVLRACGDYIKRLALPDHVKTPTLFQMLSHCSNITSLCLSPAAKLDSVELRIALQYTDHLENLEVQLSTNIKPLLQIVELKDLTVHVPIEHHSLCAPWVQEWMRNKFIPYNLNLVTEMFDIEVEAQFIESFLQWNFTPLTDYTSCFKLYYDMRIPPLNLFPSLPQFQVEFGQAAILPFVKPSRFGILGLSWDIFALTDCVNDSKKVYIMESGSLSVMDVFHRNNSIVLNKVVDNLSFVTEFSFAYSESVKPGHLEQLALACPNLQRLNLQNNFDCLTNLKGLRTIACHCRELCGLNFKYIPVTLVENHLQFWEILSGMKLTHLVIDVCVFYPLTENSTSYDEQLCGFFQKCACLQALQLESFYDDAICEKCANSTVKWSMLSYFTVLTYCRMAGNHPDVMQDIITKCEMLRIFQCDSNVCLTISSVSTTILQQLSISADLTNVPDVFMQTVSAHGGLVHFALAANSVTLEGINTVITNSPKLLTVHIWSRELVYNDRVSSKEELREDLQKRFPSRKLFTVGSFNFANFYKDIPGTDMFPLWPIYHSL